MADHIAIFELRSMEANSTNLLHICNDQDMSADFLNNKNIKMYQIYKTHIRVNT